MALEKMVFTERGKPLKEAALHRGAREGHGDLRGGLRVRGSQGLPLVGDLYDLRILAIRRRRSRQAAQAGGYAGRGLWSLSANKLRAKGEAPSS